MTLRDDTSRPETPPCPLCGGGHVSPLVTVDARIYWRCGDCQLRFVDPAHHPTAADERAQYLTHDNRTDDAAYRAFLSRLTQPLLSRLPTPGRGLDFGCGPGPVLADMLQAAGHTMRLFDPFFAPDTDALKGGYDFVTCTEVAEHFHRPAIEFQRLTALVEPGGWLAVMTCFQTDDARFAGWHYRRDPTHVVFYREATFRFLANLWGWTCEIPRKDVVLLRKPARQGSVDQSRQTV